jgi:hypothetical protein
MIRALLIALALLAAAAPAAANEHTDVVVTGNPATAAQARAHLERGLAHFGAGEFGRAVDELRAAVLLDRRPDALFALAQAERLSGSCDRAMVLYRELLDAQPSVRRAAAIQDSMALCDESQQLPIELSADLIAHLGAAGILPPSISAADGMPIKVSVAKIERTSLERISPAAARLTGVVRPDAPSMPRMRGAVFLISADGVEMEIAPTPPPRAASLPHVASNGSSATISGRSSGTSLVGGFLLVGSGLDF